MSEIVSKYVAIVAFEEANQKYRIVQNPAAIQRATR